MKKRKPNAHERQLAADWLALKEKNARPLERGAIAKAAKTNSSKQSKIPKLLIPTERNPRQIKSLDSGFASTALHERPQYTGGKMVGISQMHKSNLVPVFNDDAIKDITKMRR